VFVALYYNELLHAVFSSYPALDADISGPNPMYYTVNVVLARLLSRNYCPVG